MNRSVILIFIIAGTLLVSSVGFASQTLVVKMSPQSDQQSHLQLKHETLGATRLESEKANQVESGTKESVIGQVAIISTPKSAIKRLPNTHSRTLYMCPKDTYLAVITRRGTWYGVLMSDASTGWVREDSVRLLDYQVLNRPMPGQVSAWGKRIVDTALTYLGIPYKWGGCSVNGIDCSGFVQSVFSRQGISLPRTAREQALVGTEVPWSQLQAGDRLYFACKGPTVDHAGIYIGNGYFIHSSIRNKGVAVDRIAEPFFVKYFVVARRSI